MISFVFYACESRLENLLQAIRFLENREKQIEKEIIVVWQDRGPEIKNTKCFKLNLDSYCKPIQCNFGVKQANYDLVALLDSDRILPINYFYDHGKKLKRGEFLTTTHLFKLNKDYTDEEIEKCNFKFVTDIRSQKNEIRKKNLFSGNTLFHKNDYLDCGGMDESFIGYGYADNDMTRTVEFSGHKSLFVNYAEIHLSHRRSVNFQGEDVSQFKILSMTNLIRYCLKWKIKEEMAEKMIQEIYNNIRKFPSNQQKPFLELFKRKFGLYF